MTFIYHWSVTISNKDQPDFAVWVSRSTI